MRTGNRQKKEARWVTLCAVTALLAGCGAAGRTSQTADTANPATSSQNGSSTTGSTSGGTLALTEPTSAAAGTSKVRILLEDCQASASTATSTSTDTSTESLPPPPPPKMNHNEDFRQDHGGDHMKGGMPKWGGKGNGKAGGCVVKSAEADYAAGQSITVNDIVAGTYTVTVILENAVGQALEQGSATSVAIIDGQTATANITLAPVTQTGGSVSISITNPVAAKLVITDDALTPAISACVPVHLAIEDSNSNAALAAADVTLSLSSSASTGAFYSDSSCANAITSINIDLGYDARTVFYKDSAAGTPTLTISETSSQGLTAATINAKVGS